MFKRLLGRNRPKTITIVSGLPRSGTSLMMSMLVAGGLQPLQDGVRTADDDNPKGYFELEQVKQLDKGDASWLPDAVGKVVKIISALLLYLPVTGYQYKIIFMRRDLDEVVASQAKMLLNRQEESTVSAEEIKQLYRKHLKQVFVWVARVDSAEMLEVDYGQLVKEPQLVIPSINQFCGGSLDQSAMATVVDPTLHRNRATE